MSGVLPHSFPHSADTMRTAMPAARQFAIVLALALAGVLAALALDTDDALTLGEAVTRILARTRR